MKVFQVYLILAPIIIMNACAGQNRKGKLSNAENNKKSEAVSNIDTTAHNLQTNKNEFLEKYWKLIELNGKLVTVDNDREPHIIFKILNNRVVGNSGCNGFSSTYQLSESNGINISNILSTKMACMEVTIESEFFAAIENTNGYFIINDTLNLSRNNQTIARFKNEQQPLKY